MTNKILRSIFLAAIITFIASLLLIMWVLNNYYGELQEERLAAELSIAAVGIEQGGEGFLKKLPGNEDRFTWIAPGGKVLFDSQNDASSMENHADRKEVKDALKDGEGRSRRFSSTHTKETVYRTKRLPDGSVLRNSASRRTMLALAFSMFQPFAIIIAVAFIISFLLAENLAKKIVKPLESIDLDEPLKNNTYDELAPMLKRLAVQHSQIRNQKEELKIREREFAAVTDNMNEGLVLLNDKSTILAINPAARAFFETGEDPVGKDFLSFERNYEISRMIDDAKKIGNGEVNVSRNGREYRIGASAVESEGAGAGVVILIFDVTEKVFAERNRREFTANVSHEIKTPLQSIMGSAELIENGLVKPEDLPRFVGRIRSETARLVTLVNDAIRLSKLDENAALQFEDVDLYALAAEETKMMRRTADEKGVSLNLEGETTVVNGVKELIREIMANLCDNAVKYNVKGGSVTVSVGSDGQSAALTVADTGIGIPKESLERIFERFYRVDKSRSKEIGGTGLGLSIVKHAVQYMDGKIAVESTPGKGTKITVKLPSKRDNADA